MASPPLRYEYRIFGPSLAKVEDRLVARMTSTGTGSSEEVYLLPSAGDALNVKARGGRLEAKRLRGTERGLELWEPCFEASFPVEGEALNRLFTPSPGFPSPDLRGGAFSLDRLVDDLARRRGLLHAVRVHKRRRHFEHGEVTAEATDVDVDGRPIRTVCVECEDANRLADLLDRWGLPATANTSYPKALRGMLRLAGDEVGPEPDD